MEFCDQKINELERGGCKPILYEKFSHAEYRGDVDDEQLDKYGGLRASSVQSANPRAKSAWGAGWLGQRGPADDEAVPARGIARSPNGRYLAVISGQRVSILSDADDFENALGLHEVDQGGKGRLLHATWSPDSRLLAVYATHVARVVVLDIRGRQVDTFTRRHWSRSQPICGLAWACLEGRDPGRLVARQDLLALDCKSNLHRLRLKARAPQGLPHGAPGAAPTAGQADEPPAYLGAQLTGAPPLSMAFFDSKSLLAVISAGPAASEKPASASGGGNGDLPSFSVSLWRVFDSGGQLACALLCSSPHKPAASWLPWSSPWAPSGNPHLAKAVFSPSGDSLAVVHNGQLSVVQIKGGGGFEERGGPSGPPADKAVSSSEGEGSAPEQEESASGLSAGGRDSWAVKVVPASGLRSLVPAASEGGAHCGEGEGAAMRSAWQAPRIDGDRDGPGGGGAHEQGPSETLSPPPPPGGIGPPMDEVADVGWWSDEALLVARASGQVTVDALRGLQNLLGSAPEAFQRRPLITGASQGRVFVLEGVPLAAERGEEGATEEGDDAEEEEEEDDLRLYQEQEGHEGEEEEEVGGGALGRGARGKRRRKDGGSAGFLGRLWKRAGGRAALQRGGELPLQQHRQGGWRLISLIQRSAQEMMHIHIEAAEYGAALTLARTFGLDEGAVYKARWRRSDKGKASVGDNLAKVRDRQWVLRECAAEVAPTLEGQSALLSFGLLDTERYKFAGKGELGKGHTSGGRRGAGEEEDEEVDEEGWEGWEEDEAGEEEGALLGKGGRRGAGGEGEEAAAAAAAEEEEEAWWFRRQRLRLLQRRDMLETFLALHNGRYGPAEYHAFCSLGLRETARRYAQAGRTEALKLVLKRHPRALQPHVFEILDSLPETLAPHSYQSLLPGSAPPPAVSFRAPDWVEREQTAEHIRKALAHPGQQQQQHQRGEDESGPHHSPEVAEFGTMASGWEREGESKRGGKAEGGAVSGVAEGVRELGACEQGGGDAQEEEKEATGEGGKGVLSQKGDEGLGPARGEGAGSSGAAADEGLGEESSAGDGEPQEETVADARGREELDVLLVCTEEMARLSPGAGWPTARQVAEWYAARARAIDEATSQLDNCLALLDAGIRRGLPALTPLWDDVMDLETVVYGGVGGDAPLAELSIREWQVLGVYERFKLMVAGVAPDTVVDRLRERALPFLHRRSPPPPREHPPQAPPSSSSASTGPDSQKLLEEPSAPGSAPQNAQQQQQQPLLARWLQELAQQGDLATPRAVLAKASRGPDGNRLFGDAHAVVDAGLGVLYACPATNQWAAMAAILGTLREAEGAPPPARARLPAGEPQAAAVATAAATSGLRAGAAAAAGPPTTGASARGAGGSAGGSGLGTGSGLGGPEKGRVSPKLSLGFGASKLHIPGGLNLSSGLGLIRRTVEETKKVVQETTRKAVHDSGLAMSPFPGGPADRDSPPPLPLADSEVEAEEEWEGVVNPRVLMAEGHVEGGRLLAQYQVPVKMSFFLQPSSDPSYEKEAKQVIRRALAGFFRQPRADADWARLWRDLCTLQRGAFPFMDRTFLLSEFCRALLGAAKFDLAQVYLRGSPGSPGLPPESAEQLVMRAAQEIFYSAPGVDTAEGQREVRRARECLALLVAESPLARAEIDLIKAISETLPALGVAVVPLEVKQVPDRMEFVHRALAAAAGGGGGGPDNKAMLELARQLGLTTPAEQACVQAAVAREAAARGDVRRAAALCEELLTVPVPHGPAWDLCAALARSSPPPQPPPPQRRATAGSDHEYAPDLDGDDDRRRDDPGEGIDDETRKRLLGHALAHCDNESVDELLAAWQELEARERRALLGRATGVRVPGPREHEALQAALLAEGGSLQPDTPAVRGHLGLDRELSWSSGDDWTSSRGERALPGRSLAMEEGAGGGDDEPFSPGGGLNSSSKRRGLSRLRISEGPRSPPPLSLRGLSSSFSCDSPRASLFGGPGPARDLNSGGAASATPGTAATPLLHGQAEDGQQAPRRKEWEAGCAALAQVSSSSANASWKRRGWRGLPKELVTFACLHLPWLLEVVKRDFSSAATLQQQQRDDGGEGSEDEEASATTAAEGAAGAARGTHREGKDAGEDEGALTTTRWPPGHAEELKVQALTLILHALASCHVAPSDALLVGLARNAMAWGEATQRGEEADRLGLGYLLHVADLRKGASVLEHEMGQRGTFLPARRAMLMALFHSGIQAALTDGAAPSEVRAILETPPRMLASRVAVGGTVSNGALESPGRKRARPWVDLVVHIESRLHASEDARTLQELLPQVEIGRFAAGDRPYIEAMVLSLVGPSRVGRSEALQQALAVAGKYGIDRWKVLMAYVETVLLSEWPLDDVKAHVLQHERELLARPADAARALSARVYPTLPGAQHARLAYFFSLMLDCHMALQQQHQQQSQPQPQQPGAGRAPLPQPPAPLLQAEGAFALVGLPLGDSLQDSLASLKRYAEECTRISRAAPSLDFKRLIEVEVKGEGKAAEGNSRAEPAGLQEIRRIVTAGNVHAVAKMVARLGSSPGIKWALARRLSSHLPTGAAETTAGAGAAVEEEEEERATDTAPAPAPAPTSTRPPHLDAATVYLALVQKLLGVEPRTWEENSRSGRRQQEQEVKEEGREVHAAAAAGGGLADEAQRAEQAAEQYDVCKEFLSRLPAADLVRVLGQFLAATAPAQASSVNNNGSSTGAGTGTGAGTTTRADAGKHAATAVQLSLRVRILEDVQQLLAGPSGEGHRAELEAFGTSLRLLKGVRRMLETGVANAAQAQAAMRSLLPAGRDASVEAALQALAGSGCPLRAVCHLVEVVYGPKGEGGDDMAAAAAATAAAAAASLAKLPSSQQNGKQRASPAGELPTAALGAATSAIPTPAPAPAQAPALSPPCAAPPAAAPAAAAGRPTSLLRGKGGRGRGKLGVVRKTSASSATGAAEGTLGIADAPAVERALPVTPSTGEDGRLDAVPAGAGTSEACGSAAGPSARGLPEEAGVGAAAAAGGELGVPEASHARSPYPGGEEPVSVSSSGNASVAPPAPGASPHSSEDVPIGTDPAAVPEAEITLAVDLEAVYKLALQGLLAASTLVGPKGQQEGEEDGEQFAGVLRRQQQQQPTPDGSLKGLVESLRDDAKEWLKRHGVTLQGVKESAFLRLLDSLRALLWGELSRASQQRDVPVKLRLHAIELLNRVHPPPGGARERERAPAGAEEQPGVGKGKGNGSIWGAWLPPGDSPGADAAAAAEGGGATATAAATTTISSGSSKEELSPSERVLLLRSAEVIGASWPDVEVEFGDLRSCGAAEKLFLRLWEAGRLLPQLGAMLLLLDLWGQEFGPLPTAESADKEAGKAGREGAGPSHNTRGAAGGSAPGGLNSRARRGKTGRVGAQNKREVKEDVSGDEGDEDWGWGTGNEQAADAKKKEEEEGWGDAWDDWGAEEHGSSTSARERERAGASDDDGGGGGSGPAREDKAWGKEKKLFDVRAVVDSMHACWLLVLQELVRLGEDSEVLRLLDRACFNLQTSATSAGSSAPGPPPPGVGAGPVTKRALVTEAEARAMLLGGMRQHEGEGSSSELRQGELRHGLQGRAVIAAKIALLLPYPSVQVDALRALAQSIKAAERSPAASLFRAGASEADLEEEDDEDEEERQRQRAGGDEVAPKAEAGLDEELLLLVLASGILLLPAIGRDSTFGPLLRVLCAVVGPLARRLEEHSAAQASRKNNSQPGGAMWSLWGMAKQTPELAALGRNVRQAAAGNLLPKAAAAPSAAAATAPPFFALAFPSLVASLAVAHQFSLAGRLVSRHQRAPQQTLSIWSSGDTSLKGFIDQQVRQIQSGEPLWDQALVGGADLMLSHLQGSLGLLHARLRPLTECAFKTLIEDQ